MFKKYSLLHNLWILLIILVVVIKIIIRIPYLNLHQYEKYDVNKYFYNSQIREITIYSGSEPLKKVRMVVRDQNEINLFKVSINQSVTNVPNHPMYSQYIYIRVITEDKKHYDFLCRLLSNDQNNVYISDVVGGFELKSESLRSWLRRLKVYY